MAFRKGSILSVVTLLLGLSLVLDPAPSFGQTQEPDVIPLPEPRTPLSEGKHNSLGFEVMINNFGFGIGGHYSRVLGPFTQLTFETGITGIRDVSEQTFTDPFFGQQIIPNKYNRAMAFPFMFGLKKRFFAQKISDNFRFFVAGSGGPVLAFVYPYFNDSNGNGFRDNFIINTDNGPVRRTESVNDFFSGWKDGETQWGMAGEFKVGVDIGENFSKLTTVEFGYYFYYFTEGIQMMEPRRPVINNQGQYVPNPDGTLASEPFFDAQKYYGTPQITLTFGGMW
ncbi:hypothetical protein NC796_20700 [Aliifodinibius sp. S!AR15-10]|uniref:hypothetical protein n=1 Tax=Aliifodinibius sp. S!AR15-10 TaxID=2950437 RepID=UPI00285EA6E6|nr:hypothetical protein [Aliifodinibius sp. S!AR15-10]MDR8393585.1 hypothetical protein [Aliifodinibius sp. S!AR15-10]